MPPHDPSTPPPPGGGVDPLAVEREVIARLVDEPWIVAAATALVGRVGDDGERVDLYGQPFVIGALEGYRASGGVIACPVWGPAAAVRHIMAVVADGMAGSAARIDPAGPQAPLREALTGGAGRLRSALDPVGSPGPPAG